MEQSWCYISPFSASEGVAYILDHIFVILNIGISFFPIVLFFNIVTIYAYYPGLVFVVNFFFVTKSGSTYLFFHPRILMLHFVVFIPHQPTTMIYN